MPLARRAAASFLALIGLSLFGTWIASCNDDSNGRVCIGGETRLCSGLGRCQGSQACLDDGSGYGDCDCSGPLRQGSTDVTGDQPITPLVGRHCKADAECGAGLRCFTESSNSLFGGGPAGGYCTTECVGTDTCTAIDVQSDCIGVPGTQTVCLRTCRSQDPTSLAENKCLTRTDVVCKSEVALNMAMFSGARQRGWCFPQCGSDEDCPGRVCDLNRGLCVNTPPAGLPLGDHCENTSECAGGLCIAVSPGEQFCSAPCIVDQPVGCGDGPSVTTRNGGCLGALYSGILSSEGAGDVGFCAELCDVDADCVQATSHGWVCIKSETNRARFGREGVCFPPEPSDGGTDAGDAATVQDASTADGG